MGALIAEDLAVSVMDALVSNICVVDLNGDILAVNRAWMEFSAANAGGGKQTYVGTNYLNVCRRSTGSASDEASEFHVGLRAVIEGRSELFEMEYPCHSPEQLRWFSARVTPLLRRKGPRNSEQAGAVVSHMNITDRKLLEMEYQRLASTDPLTGLPNRRFLEDYARIELGRLRRFGADVSVLMLDLDAFKAINDRHGHIAGDAVLKAVAQRCKTAVRENDLFARIGGEEFVVMLPETDEAGAVVLAEKIRAMIEDLEIESDAGLLRVTSSIGVTSVTPEDPSIDTAMHRADTALYAAKNAGRNRVHVAE